MAVKLQKPILVGGITLSVSLWALESLHHSLGQMGEFTVLGAMALGGGFWLWQQRTPKNSLNLDEKPLNKEMLDIALTQAQAVVTQLETEAPNHTAISSLKDKLTTIPTEITRKELNIVVAGGKGTGKTTLIQLLEEVLIKEVKQNLSFQETLPLFTEMAATTTETITSAADIVFLIINGDLTASEFQFCQQLKATNHRLILVFNKQDQFLPTERDLIFQQLHRRFYDTVAIAAAPNQIKVRQHQSDNCIQEWMEQPQPDLINLTTKLNHIIAQESQQLILATTWRKTVALKAEAKMCLNVVRSDRALPMIEKYQWIAAATAFANPIAALDLLATAAITAQMVMDLGSIYQQKLSLSQAQTAAGTLGSLMLKLGLVELSTQTISSVLKSNALTYLAGGLVQGVSAAYLTRVAGLSLIEYLQSQELETTDAPSWNFEALSKTVNKVFQENQRIAFLQSFVKQAVSRILPESSPNQSTEIVG